jgi:hypothetical protein
LLFWVLDTFYDFQERVQITAVTASQQFSLEPIISEPLLKLRLFLQCGHDATTHAFSISILRTTASGGNILF